MDYQIITAPSQMRLIEDIIFDLTSVPLSIGELVTMTLAVVAIQLIYKSPLFANA